MRILLVLLLMLAACAKPDESPDAKTSLLNLWTSEADPQKTLDFRAVTFSANATPLAVNHPLAGKCTGDFIIDQFHTSPNDGHVSSLSPTCEDPNQSHFSFYWRIEGGRLAFCEGYMGDCYYYR